MSREAFEKIKHTCDLPSPTGVAMEIVQLAGNENTKLEELSDVIETDPATASRILKYVNSPLAGLKNEIASIQHAITLLGMVRVKDIALSFSLVNAGSQNSCPNFDYADFWQEASARAAAIRHLAHRLKCCQPDEAFTCGLLSRIGCLGFATACPQAYSTALAMVPKNDVDALLKIEEEMFDINHRDFGAELLTDWLVPRHICEAIRKQGIDLPRYDATQSTERLPWLLELSGLFAELLTSGSIPRSTLSTTINRSASAGIRPDHMEQVYESMGHEWRDLGKIMDVETRPEQAYAEMYARAIWPDEADAREPEASQ